MEILSVESLAKKYGKKTALRNVNIKVLKGEIVGFIGPNGAGKTTFIKCITGLLKPQEGSINLFGYNLFQHYGKVMKNVGLLLEPAFYDYLTAFENLKILMKVSGNYDLKKIEEVMEFVGLWEVRNKYVTTFSFGMKQRLGLAQALMNDPQFLILDEPTVGLDPVGVNELKEKLRYLSRDKGVTILFSSHQLSDVEEICDRVVLIKEGSILYNGSINDITSQKEYHVILSTDKVDLESFKEEIMNGLVNFEDTVLIVKDREILGRILRKLFIQNIDILDINIKKGSLIELFYEEGMKQQ
ncbi:ABC transporter ATP-binding protein [Thermoanaerobacter sp. A7A]|uniref:ABC transporter ATP-binding protein n=1 Tax=Thermoanaerobacter sp. A7A TaxID=1350366 RepID=UPI000425EB72|nr:ABC transporter ATP-binding protein [Thermoanaerobacter sp. A7A]